MSKTMRRTMGGRRVRENTRRTLREDRTQEAPGMIPVFARASFSTEEAFSIEDMEKSFALFEESKASEAVASYGGWIGMAGQVEHYLAMVGADRDEQGRFLVGGSVVVGMGGEEVVLGNDAYYLAGGQKCNLAAGLRSTSYGVAVAVIAEPTAEYHGKPAFLPGEKHVSSSIGRWVNYTGKAPTPSEVWAQFPKAIIVDGDDDWYAKVEHRPQVFAREAGIEPIGYFHTGISGISCSGIVVSPEQYEALDRWYTAKFGAPMAAQPALRVHRPTRPVTP